MNAETEFPLVSIITIVHNNEKNVKDALQSVLSQDYQNIEYVVIDGNSTDGTVNIIEEYADKITCFISEPDDGIYDALNKGIKKSNGVIVGILHSDDLFSDEHVVSDAVQEMTITKSEICFSDLVIVDEVTGKIIRYYMAHYFQPWLFKIGWLPPHPTCFINRSLFDEFGLYSNNYKVAGDFDFLVRIFYGRKILWSYINRVTVKMRRGGKSNSGIIGKVECAKEIRRSLVENNVWSLSIFQVFRYVIRFFELILRPK
jgi:glycosyltransferase involved in cell wall biosynthesis